MKPFPHESQDDLLTPLRLHDFEASWAGDFPYIGGFCIGSEDGRLLFTHADGVKFDEMPDASLSKEAINGVAFIKKWMSVSTRTEVMLWMAGPQGQQPTMFQFPFGAHSVIAGIGGYFFAPLGLTGLAFYQPKDGIGQGVTITNSLTEEVYVYRVASLRSDSGKEIVACAIRKGGFAAMQFEGEDRHHNLSVLSFHGLDLVDVCPLDVEGQSGATVAVSKDCTLILFKDALQDRSPLTLRYDGIKGTAYRLLSARGYLFLLTSDGLYAIGDLVDRFLKGLRGHHEAPVLHVAMDAVDANRVGDKWVLIVTTRGVSKLDVDLLEKNAPTYLSRGHMRELRSPSMTPEWTGREVEQSVKAVPAGA